MNQICLSGRLTADPSFQHIEGGNHRCFFILANNEYYGSEQKTGFYKVKAWGKKAEVIHEHCKSGTELFITGRLEQWRYEDESGKTVYDNSITIDSFDFGKKPLPANT